MKNLKQILFTLAMVVGLALSVSAQKGGNDPKRPPKEPKVIKPSDKDRPPPRNPPKGDDRGGKKPGMAYYLVTGKEDEEAAQ